MGRPLATKFAGLVRGPQPASDVKFDKSGGAVRHIQKPEALRNRQPSSEMQIKCVVSHYMEEGICPGRRCDREARKVGGANGDVSRPLILGNKVGEYEDAPLRDRPRLLVIGHKTAIQENKTPLNGDGH
jgi:hypothetical protein